MTKEEFREWCDEYDLFSRFQIGSIAIFQIHLENNPDKKNFIMSELQKLQMAGKIDDFFVLADMIKVYLPTKIF
jgi:hypothetical protein